MLGLMQERIEHRLPGVEKEEETLFLFERLDGRSDEHVDARDYLRASATRHWRRTGSTTFASRR